MHRIFIEEQALEKVEPEKCFMVRQELLPHWNNFTVLELREILEHCSALDKLGIAQDESMITSIERDITIRAKRLDANLLPNEKHTENKNKQKNVKVTKGQKSHEYLLEQNLQVPSKRNGVDCHIPANMQG